mmetsp:Transcript_100566/g.260339  ORF Transcript_100566/g.260339 Transcript_100566/m.260339 type:complete len:365 (+) Transcript_100566:116-1210(+)
MMAEERPVKPAGRECELFNDNIFCALRAYAQVPDDFVNAGWSLDQLQNGGGKGGTLMARVGSTYIVKELSKSDHAVLLELAGSYGQHVRSGETLLCPIYLHFRDVVTGRVFFAMRNSIGVGPFAALYDLKGCADDKLIEKGGEPIKAVHKRIWNVGMWAGKCSWSKDRRIYHQGKVEARSVEIPLMPDQREKVLKAIERDTQWLASHRLMDYSLLVAVKSAPSGVSASGGSAPSALGQRPLLYKTNEGQDMATYIAIIDFLQRWTAGKRVARVIKCMECNKATVPPKCYARRFSHHFAGRLVALPAASAASGAAGAAAAKAPVGVAPPAGDCGQEGQPEDRLNSRPIPEDGACETLSGKGNLRL